MKIKSTDSVSSSVGVRKAGKTKSAGGSSFASHLQETEETQGVMSTSAVSNVDSLLSLQAMGSSTDKNTKARQHGEEVLDVLERVLHDLLAGGVPVSRLRNLADMMQRQREYAGVSPKMLEIIDEIETRALVELAKLEAYL
ncbi:MAG: hypothetical protein EYC62_01380 [Alphaproteobacteria bacterium]|nr:MAG: hypothetical protein EYC62_01380 [Alphaproteobacteria bacterium]